MSSKPEVSEHKPASSEQHKFCGYCGGRLPDIGEGQYGSCPACRRCFGKAKRVRRPPPPPISYSDEMIEMGIPFQKPSGYRDPVLASLLSAVIPGMGQWYNCQFIKGLLVFFFSWLVIPYFLGIFDAYLTAERTNCWQTAGNSRCD